MALPARTKDLLGWGAILGILILLIVVYQPTEQEPESVEFLVFNGQTILYTDTSMEAANPFEALLQAASEGNLDVQADRSGPCTAYVRAINGVAEGSQGSSSGWIYVVIREGEETAPAIASDCFELEGGDRIEWRFITDPSEYPGL